MKMFIRNNLIILSIFIITVRNCHAQKGTCTKVNSCKCTYDDGAIVDLTPLDSGDDTPKFKDVSGKVATTLYSWNPCSSFTEQECEEVAVCQLQEDLPPVVFKSLGTQDSATFTKDDDGNPAIQYEVEEEGVLTTTRISLLCGDADADDLLYVKDEGKLEGKYLLELTSYKACPTTAQSSGSLSVGTYILITFFVIVMTFFLVGTLVQKFVRKQSGKDIIPFVNFWTQLPGLIKAGVLSILCRGKRDAYEYK